MTKLRELMKDNLRDRAMFETLNVTGATAREICNMQISHVDLEERQIFIPKGKNLKPRIVLFSHICKE